MSERAIKQDERFTLTCSKVPKYVFWTDDYPRTASGKIQKFKLRDNGIELVKEGQGD